MVLLLFRTCKTCTGILCKLELKINCYFPARNGQLSFGVVRGIAVKGLEIVTSCLVMRVILRSVSPRQLALFNFLLLRPA